MRRILTGVLCLAALAGSAFAADYGNDVVLSYGHHGNLPQCDEPSVTARIAEKFSYYDAHVIQSGIGITAIDGQHEVALTAGGPSLVDRRYCGATAWLTDGRKSEVVYLIEGPKLGTFSIGWHVESCLPGYDPWHVYDARCRSIRP